MKPGTTKKNIRPNRPNRSNIRSTRVLWAARYGTQGSQLHGRDSFVQFAQLCTPLRPGESPCRGVRLIVSGGPSSPSVVQEESEVTKYMARGEVTRSSRRYAFKGDVILFSLLGHV